LRSLAKSRSPLRRALRAPVRLRFTSAIRAHRSRPDRSVLAAWAAERSGAGRRGPRRGI